MRSLILVSSDSEEHKFILCPTLVHDRCAEQQVCSGVIVVFPDADAYHVLLIYCMYH